MIEFRGPAKKLSDQDLPRIGKLIGVGEDEIHAVLDVESAGSGFDSSGRPKMLFEPHIFYRNLSGDKRARAISEGLAYAAWRPGAYPKDSYPRLIAAINIDETAALCSASYGLGQILGENFAAAGFKSVQAMVAAFVASEANQLEGMVQFIKTKKLDRHLRAHDWAAFAQGYNGNGYKKNAYDTKLANAFARWQRIKDTPLAQVGPLDVHEPVGKLGPSPQPVSKPGNKTGNVAGSIGVIVATGSGAVIASQSSKKGAGVGEIAIVVGLTLVIAIAVFFTIRHIVKKG